VSDKSLYIFVNWREPSSTKANDLISQLPPKPHQVEATNLLFDTGIRKKEVTTSIISNKIIGNVRRLKNLVIIFRMFFTPVELDYEFCLPCQRRRQVRWRGRPKPQPQPKRWPSEVSRQRHLHGMLGGVKLHP
jgi:hypothetical protein